MKKSKKVFISIPNNCTGCPLEMIVPMKAKITHSCGLYSSEWEVTYKLDDLGRTKCELEEKEIEEPGGRLIRL